jgi:hypothetical protein
LPSAAEIEAVADSDISVVIQGPLLLGRTEGVERCLDSLRSVLPGAEVIVSTWEGEDAGAVANRALVVKSPDPGCFTMASGLPINLNRLQRSTLAGLRRAGRRYSLKLRSDLALTDRRFLVSAPARPGSLFARPLTMSNLYLRDPEKFTLLFHFSDIAQFGLTRDLLSFWDGGLFAEDELLFPPGVPGGARDRLRLFPEQAATLRWLSRHGVDARLVHPAHIDRTLLALWARVLAANVHLVDWRKSGIVYPERFATDPSSFATLLSEEKFAELPVRGFDYRKARFHALVLDRLLHGGFARFVERLRARFPLVNRALRRAWSFYHGLSR